MSELSSPPITLAVLAQGYRKEPLFHTKHRSGRDRESNPGHLLGRQRH
jgi:hypothetical protein